jgi:hypothetical protein
VRVVAVSVRRIEPGDVTGPFEILLRILNSIAQLAYVPGRKMTAPHYKSVSAIGNRVTFVTFRGNTQAARERCWQLGADRGIIRISWHTS